MTGNSAISEQPQPVELVDLMKRRRPWLIVLLGLLSSSYTFVYCGQLLRGVLWQAVLFLASVLAYGVSLYFIDGLSGLIAAMTITVGIFVAMVIDALRQGKRQAGKPSRPYQKWWAYLALLIVFLIAQSFLLNIKTKYWVESFVVSFNSMNETLVAGDRFMVDKLFFDPEKLSRNRVVVFHPPNDQQIVYVQRLIAKAGDTVEINRTQVFLNGELLNEPFAIYKNKVAEDLLPVEMKFLIPSQVPEGYVFLLGDNRWESNDSRFLEWFLLKIWSAKHKLSSGRENIRERLRRKNILRGKHHGVRYAGNE